MKKWIVSAAILITICGYSQNLKLVLTKGQKFEVTSETKVNSVAEVMGQIMENNTEKVAVQIIEVTNVMNAVKDLAIITTKLQVRLESKGQEMKYDSEKKDNPMMLEESFGKEVGKIRNISVDSSGNLVKEYGSVQNSVVNMDILTGALQEGSVPFFQTAFIGKSFIANSTWYDSLVTGSEKMKTTITGYYSIKSVENNIAVVLFSGVQKTIGVTEQMGQEFRMTSTNKVNAEIKVDLNTGIILSSSTIYDGIMYIDAGGMLIPVTIKTTSVSNIKIL